MLWLGCTAAAAATAAAGVTHGAIRRRRKAADAATTAPEKALSGMADVVCWFVVRAAVVFFVVGGLFVSVKAWDAHDDRADAQRETWELQGAYLRTTIDAACDSDLAPGAVEALAGAVNRHARAVIAERGVLPEMVVVALSEDPEIKVREIIAGRGVLPEMVMALSQHDPDLQVRAAIAGRGSLPVTVPVVLVCDPNRSFVPPLWNTANSQPRPSRAPRLSIYRRGRRRVRHGGGTGVVSVWRVVVGSPAA